MNKAKPDWKKVEKFLKSVAFFTDGNLTDHDIPFEWVFEEGNWERFEELFMDHGFELVEAKKKGGEYSSAVYVNLDKFSNPEIEVGFSDKAVEIFPPELLGGRIKKLAREMAKLLGAGSVGVGTLLGHLRMDFYGDLEEIKRTQVLEKLAEENGLEIIGEL